MNNLEAIRKAFEEIKKSVAYAELMTQLEKLYKLPLLEIQVNENTNQEALKLYKEISRARTL